MNIQQQTRPHAEREYLHTFTAGALLPMVQATLLAGGVFLGVWITARLVFDAVDPHKSAILFSVITWVWTIFRLFRHWLSLTTVETILQRDINGDGMIGNVAQPSAQSEARKIRIELSKVTEGRYQSNTIDFPCDDEQLNTLAMGLINGMSFSEKTWAGEGKVFSSPEFRALKDVMKKHNLAEYVSEKDVRQGMRLTEEGRALMEKIAPPSPAPLEDE